MVVGGGSGWDAELRVTFSSGTSRNKTEFTQVVIHTHAHPQREIQKFWEGWLIFSCFYSSVLKEAVIVVFFGFCFYRWLNVFVHNIKKNPNNQLFYSLGLHFF